MKVLVTGATGLLGAELTRQLLQREVDVRIFHRPTSTMDLLGTAADEVEHAVGDVTDVSTLLPAVEDVDRIYHTAALVGFGGKQMREKLRRVNVEGTANVVNAALEAGIDRLVHTSSMAAFGRPEKPGGIIDESSSWKASEVNTEYARSKYQAELEVHRGIAEGLDAVIVNPALIFGAGRPGQNTRRIVERVRDRNMPGVPAGGTNVVDVKDVADGHIRAMRHGRCGERYFLGSENLPWRTIIDRLAEAFGVAPPRYTIPPHLLMGLAVGFEAVSLITKRPPLLTRETARTASRFYRYSNRKAVDELGCSFRPFPETARLLAAEMTGSNGATRS